MYRRVRSARPLVPPGSGPGRLLAAVLLGVLGLNGCAHQQTRFQSEDETERDRYQVTTIGEKTQVGNAEPIPVSGVGLVEGLEGTGGDVPADGFRAMLEKDLAQQKERHIRDILSSPNNALVLVSGLLPPGARPGDPIDVEVTLPRNSKATSLRGGRLRKCQLYNYDFAKHLDPNYTGSSGLLLGHPIAEAQGPVLVGLGGKDDDSQRQGRIWAGGRSRVDQPLTLVMNSDQQYARMTALIADRVNETFQAGVQAGNSTAIAYTRDQLAIYLRVPAQYKLNMPRYLRVVRLIPLREGLDGPSKRAEAGRPSYRQRLAEDLLDPARTVVAALRLEALGQHSIPALKRGLEAKHPLVRFCAAEALAYLGSPSGVEELARAVTEQPLLRPFGLTALASLDEAVCQIKLGELLALACDDETRYGAFRALYTLDPNNQAVRGEMLNDSYWLHRTAPNTPPLVHVSTTKRAEVVLFGEEAFLKPPFYIMAGEFVITAVDRDTRCTLSRFPLRGGQMRRQCSLRLEEVLRTLADMGGAFPETVSLLQQADKCRCLSCRVRYDALPQRTSVYELVQAGKELGGEAELVPGGQDLGLTPNLYDTGSAQEQERRLQASRGNANPSSERAAARRPASAGE
jgi:hypothetical protein